MVLSISCGSRTAMEREREVITQTRVDEDGGTTSLRASLFFKSDEAMAIQQVPYSDGPEAARNLEAALHQFQKQWTMQLTIGPKNAAGLSELERLSLDIENNGGMWRDHARNLQRVLFEMGDFIHLKLPGGTEIPPLAVEYQRSFGMGLDRHFILIFPKEFQGKPVQPPFEVVVREFGQGMGTLRFQVQKTPGRLAFWRVKRLWKQSSPIEKS